MNFTPKNIFKGEHSDGKKFTVDEWEYGSVGAMEAGEFWPMAFLSVILMVIASPLMLLISLLTYNGNIKISNIVGMVIGSYFLVDVYDTWICSLFASVFINESLMVFFVTLTIASLIGHIFLFILTICFNRFGSSPRPFIFLIVLVMTFVSFDYANQETKNHNFFEYKTSDPNDLKLQPSN